MESKTFDTELLCFFKSLMETASLTKTSSQMGLSQASASRLLSRLRELFQDDLFLRTRGGMQPTARAQEVFPRVISTLSSLDSLLQPEVFDPLELNQTIRIGAVDNGVFAIIGHVIDELFTKAPHMSLEIVPIAENLYEQIESGDIDLAVYPEEPLPPDFHEVELFEDDYVCIVRKEHPLAIYAQLKEEPPIEELNRYQRIMITAKGGKHGHTVGNELYENMEQRTVLWVPYFLSVPFLLSKSDLTLVLPKRTATYLCKIEPLVILPIHKSYSSYKARIIWHHRNHKNAAIKWVKDLLVKYAKIH